MEDKQRIERLERQVEESTDTLRCLHEHNTFLETSKFRVGGVIKQRKGGVDERMCITSVQPSSSGVIVMVID